MLRPERRTYGVRPMPTIAASASGLVDTTDLLLIDDNRMLNSPYRRTDEQVTH